MRLMSLLIASVLAAALFYGLQTERIILNTSLKSFTPDTQTNTVTATLHWDEDLLQAETCTIIQTDDAQENLYRLINTWLHFLHNEEVHKKMNAETAMLSPSGGELFISFDRKPFTGRMSIAEKMGFIRYLFKTIKPHTAARKVRLLVHHTPLHDAHLDFSTSWPIDF